MNLPLPPPVTTAIRPLTLKRLLISKAEAIMIVGEMGREDNQE
jgi:hypothetical protein